MKHDEDDEVSEHLAEKFAEGGPVELLRQEEAAKTVLLPKDTII